MATYNNIKKIKIGEDTFNLYDSGNSGGTITKVATSAGAHSTITVTSGAASFNVPTKTSHLTNDSGYVTTSGVTTITTSAGAHTTKSAVTGAVSFNVPTKTSHLTNDSGFITSSSIPAAGTDDPIVDGTASPGESAKFAREDHVHPTDTSRAASSHTHSVTITPSTTSVYSITGVGTANVPTKIDTTKFNGGSFTRGSFSGGSGSFTQGSFSGGSGSFTQGSFSGGSLTMSINGTDSKQLDITFTAATHGADSHTHVAATHGADSHTHTAATHAADSFTAASLGTGFYTAGTASTVPTRSQVSNLWNGYTSASAS